MCGIFGAFQGSPSNDVDARIRRAKSTLKHRGPNSQKVESEAVGKGFLHLGHTRLSIIDLSPAGIQPMHSPDGRYSIVFNGEIYNYKELRAELQSLGYEFCSDSDTEVLLLAWSEWGETVLSRLVGMFAFVILDRIALKLTCIRDAFGIKPLFYSFRNGDFFFASEIPTLQVLMPQKAGFNWQRSYDYLVHGEYDVGPSTFFDQIWQLQPGMMLVVNLQDQILEEPKRWWVPRIAECISLKFEDAVEQLRHAFLDSVRLHLRSDVPVGAALSGGLDSSAIVCAMRHIAPDLEINTFSFIAEGSQANEEKWVDIVNQHVGSIPHKVTLTADELVGDLDRMLLAQGEPFGSMSIYAQFRVYQLAKEQGVTVTLDGQGADEVLGGYIGFPGERVHSLWDRGEFASALSFLYRWSQWPGRSKAGGGRAVLAELSSGHLHELLRLVSGKNRERCWVDSNIASDMGIFPRLKRFQSGDAAHGRRVVAQMENMLTRHGLPALLRHGDRNSMCFSVESRVPFLTLGLAELMLSMPEHYLVSPEGETKHLFRKAMKGIVPDEVLFRRDKIGFEPPEREWVLNISTKARQWLSEDMGIPFIRREALLREFDEVVSGRRAFSWQVWRWINFYRWMACVENW